MHVVFVVSHLVVVVVVVVVVVLTSILGSPFSCCQTLSCGAMRPVELCWGLGNLSSLDQTIQFFPRKHAHSSKENSRYLGCQTHDANSTSKHQRNWQWLISIVKSGAAQKWRKADLFEFIFFHAEALAAVAIPWSVCCASLWRSGSRSGGLVLGTRRWIGIA